MPTTFHWPLTFLPDGKSPPLPMGHKEALWHLLPPSLSTFHSSKTSRCAPSSTTCCSERSLHTDPAPPHSPPGSSVHGILQARIREWVVIPFSRGSSGPGDRTRVSPAMQVDSLPTEPPSNCLVSTYCQGKDGSLPPPPLSREHADKKDPDSTPRPGFSALNV